ncbi:MAG: hypothetical protein JO306_03155 [Gemmatimonadetes bacterium]|nr:hypothetical protein [Gemmatimonadota bacterium]
MLLLSASVALALAAADTGTVPISESPQPLLPPATPSQPLSAAAAPVPVLAAAPARADTTPARPHAFEYSDAYGRRLAVHRIASYATIPLFIAQYASGSQLMNKGTDAPSWARTLHGPTAAALGGLFLVNTYTGGLNLLEARKDPEGRTKRTIHGLLMLAADAGFAATGLLSSGARDSQSRRNTHRAVAFGSMGISLVGYGIMLVPGGN